MITEAERKGFCQSCGDHSETRPYGSNGEEICFKCGMKDIATTEKKMGIFLFGDKP